MSFSRNTIILIASALIVGGGCIYYFFFYTRDQGSAVSVSGVPGSDAELIFVNLASQVNPITFDTAVLSDPRFLTLTDIRTTIVPEISGRKDPFAPISGVAHASVSGTSAGATTAPVGGTTAPSTPTAPKAP